MQNLYQAAYDCLMLSDIEQKLISTTQLYAAWQVGECDWQHQADAACSVHVIPVAGRPEKPMLVDSRHVKQRGLGSLEGRQALLHAVAHIEFNAINLALDAVYRFRGMPEHYYRDWLQVAAEEAYHFQLIQTRLHALGSYYGALPAHNGLWEHACKTDYDVMVRMALVPRVLEARGLDVTPNIMLRLKEVGDTESVALLEIILRDEIGHVRIGSYWFRHACEQRQLEPEMTFRQLLRDVLQSPIHAPFNVDGRLQAGFTEAELTKLAAMEQEWFNEIKR